MVMTARNHPQPRAAVAQGQGPSDRHALAVSEARVGSPRHTPARLSEVAQRFAHRVQDSVGCQPPGVDLVWTLQRRAA